MDLKFFSECKAKQVIDNHLLDARKAVLVVSLHA
jgi:hypothetical protein